MTEQPPCYMAFLLRLWCVTEYDGVVWRASLEDAHTGERRGFADVQLLYIFLDKQIYDASHGVMAGLVDKRGDLQ